MQLLETVTQQHEAQLLKDLLKSHGIECNVLGSRDYASIVLGSLQGRYRLMVPEADMDRARNLIREARVRHADEPTTGPDPFRRAVFFAFAAAVILPVVFNYSSLHFGWKYWQASPKDFKARMKYILILLLQLPTILINAYVIHNIWKSGFGF